jgi:hypothetical protein
VHLIKEVEKNHLLVYSNYKNWICFSPKEFVLFPSHYLVCFNTWNVCLLFTCFQKLTEIQDLTIILKEGRSPAADSSSQSALLV